MIRLQRFEEFPRGYQRVKKVIFMIGTVASVIVVSAGEIFNAQPRSFNAV